MASRLLGIAKKLDMFKKFKTIFFFFNFNCGLKKRKETYGRMDNNIWCIHNKILFINPLNGTLDCVYLLDTATMLF